MSIRDIIEAAARSISMTAEDAADSGLPGWQGVLDDADTILAHVHELAFMEAVCEDARAFAACCRAECDPCTPDGSAIECRICATTRALSEHRKERGL